MFSYHHGDDNAKLWAASSSNLQALNAIVCWLEGPNSEPFKMHLARMEDYIWIAEDGMKIKV